jgi:hypothetical protein
MTRERYGKVVILVYFKVFLFGGEFFPKNKLMASTSKNFIIAG